MKNFHALRPGAVLKLPHTGLDGFLEACARGHLRLVTWFVEILHASVDHALLVRAVAGAAPSPRYDGPLAVATPFFVACAGGHLRTASYLFRRSVAPQ